MQIRTLQLAVLLISVCLFADPVLHAQRLSPGFSHREQTDTVLQRYRQWLFDTYPRAEVTRLLETYDPLLQWSDINYHDTQPADWQVAQHLKRVRDLALAWTDPASHYYRNARLWQIIEASLDHWLHKRYKSVNWWHNKIGVPQAMRDVAVLIGHLLPPEKYEGVLEVIAQYGSWQTHTGANLVWSADLALHYGALAGNDSIMHTAAKYLVKEVKISAGEGIQYDYSFHQHDRRLQMYHYGRAFLWDHIRLAWQLRNTRWKYPDHEMAILTDFILNGWQWMARGIHTVPGTLDRAVSRPGALRHADIRKLIPYLSVLDPARASDWKTLEKWQNGNSESVKGFRYFPLSDFAVYHTEAFSFFLKTISTRTLPAESINNENLKGNLLHSGDAYIIRDGNEYYNLMPVWDWQLLPGVTTFTGAAGIRRSDGAGSVSDDTSGVTSMDYRLQDKNGNSVAAKKAWFCHNSQVICLIAGLQKSNVGSNVFTALDQSRWRGRVTADGKKIRRTGAHSFKSAKWLHHAGIGYIFLKPEAVSLHLNAVTGSWRSINASATDSPVTEKVFKPVLQHNALSGSTGTGYVLASCKTPAAAASLARNPGWTIVRNDSLCQAVVWKDGTAMLAFHAPGEVRLNNERAVAVSGPCLLLIKGNVVYASDPSHRNEEVTLSISNKTIFLPLPANGYTTRLDIANQ